jgi:H+/Cl- antiporter ClcA
MKKALHAILKLLLVLAIFLGLQGRVLVRYAEIFHKKHKSELVQSGITTVKAGIVHCKLQCYTQHFQVLDLPLIAFLFSLITASLITDLLYISFKEKLSIAGSVRLLPLRAPPVL